MAGEKVGFIGLGLMGKPMALNLLKAGFNLTVHNRSRGKVDELAGQGATAANSAAELTRQVDIVISCLPGPADVEKVYLGADGVLANGRASQLWIDMSTIDAATHQRIATEAAAKDIAYLDAPVTGGTYGAERGTLTIMVGGTAAALERARPVLEAMGANIYHLGPVGSGAVAKLVNNMISAVNVSGFIEAMVLGAKFGLDPAQLFEVISSGTADSKQFSAAMPSVLARNFEPGFTTTLMAKDVALATDLARQLGVRLLAGNLASQIMQEGVAAGLGERSFYSVIKVLEQNAGVEVVPRQE